MSEEIKIMHTLHDTIDELEKVVPEIKNQRHMIGAIIKTYVHHEKSHTWFMINLHFGKHPWFYIIKWYDKLLFKFGFLRYKNIEWHYRHFKDHVDSKLETHSEKNWGNLETNLD